MNATFEWDKAELNKLIKDLTTFAKLPPKVCNKAVNKKAKIHEDAIKKHAASDLTGPYFAGQVAANVKRTSARTTGSGTTAQIKWNAVVLHEKDARAGEVAFLNEYGTEKMPARPYITRALTESGSKGYKAAADVLLEWKKQNNL